MPDLTRLIEWREVGPVLVQLDLLSKPGGVVGSDDGATIGLGQLHSAKNNTRKVVVVAIRGVISFNRTLRKG